MDFPRYSLSVYPGVRSAWGRVSFLIPWKQLKTAPAVKAFTDQKCYFLQKILNEVQITFFPLAAKGRQAEFVSNLVSFHYSSQLLLLSFLEVFVSILSLLECSEQQKFRVLLSCTATVNVSDLCSDLQGDLGNSSWIHAGYA